MSTSTGHTRFLMRRVILALLLLVLLLATAQLLVGHFNAVHGQVQRTIEVTQTQQSNSYYLAESALRLLLAPYDGSEQRTLDNFERALEQWRSGHRELVAQTPADSEAAPLVAQTESSYRTLVTAAECILVFYERRPPSAGCQNPLGEYVMSNMDTLLNASRVYQDSVGQLLRLEHTRDNTNPNPIHQIAALMVLLVPVTLATSGWFIIRPAVRRMQQTFDQMQQTQEQLRSGEARYRSLIAAMAEGVIVIETGGTISTCNPAAAEILGYTVEELTQDCCNLKDRWDMLREDGSRFPPQQFPALLTLENGQPQRNVIIGVRRPDRTRVWISMNTQPIFYSIDPDDDTRPSHSAPQAVVLSFTDITMLKQREHSYRALFEQSNDAVCLLDLHGVNFRTNARGAEMFGVEHPDDIIGISTWETAVTAERGSSREVYVRLMSGEKLPIYERQFQRQDGSAFTAEVNITLVRDEEGSPLFFQSMVRDITERKTTEAALRESAVQLALERARTDLIASFVRDISHEFRTPLSIINTKLYLLCRVEDPARKAIYEQGIREQVDNVARLVEMLVTMSRLDSESVTSADPVFVNTLVTELLTRFARASEEDGLTLSTVLDAHPDRVIGSSIEISRALGHIVENALQFTPPGGSVVIRTASDPKRVTIIVEDTGIGIPPEALPRIFERFYRADNAHTTKGIGLGLPIARKIIETHGGSIQAANRVEGGTVMTVTLPAAR